MSRMRENQGTTNERTNERTNEQTNERTNENKTHQAENQENVAIRPAPDVGGRVVGIPVIRRQHLLALPLQPSERMHDYRRQ
jgi:hypothetical protein